jgi:serine/threonine protein phosphatase PrpC
MADEKRWRIIGKSVLGASHSRGDLPNQDAISWKQKPDTGVPLVLSIADGHGSERYFRSDVGAKFAVQVAIEVMNRFEKGLIPSSSLSNIEVDAQRLPLQIVSQWKQLVENHWEATGPNEREWKWLRKKENAEAWKTITANPAIPYGATLLTVLLTERFIVYLQLGDGDILTVGSDGDIDEPVPGDERNLANETTSLCDPKAAGDFRMHFQRLEVNKPALIMLSTDGYANSFRERKGFYKVGSDIWQMISSGREAGLKTVEDSLEGWLHQASKIGSGDDITVGLLCRMSALKEALPEPGLPGGAVTQKGRELPELSTRVNPEEIPPLSSGGGHLPPVKPVDSSAVKTAISRPAPLPGTKDVVVPQGAPVVVSSTQQVLIVSKGQVEGQYYTSIGEAIKAAHPKAQIRVFPGQYQESFVLDKEVEIIGDGPRQDIVIKSVVPCILMRTDYAVIQGITVQGTLKLASSLLSQGKPAIDIPYGQLVLRNCAITSQSSKCLHVHGSVAKLIIIGCDIYRGERGLVVSEQAQGQVENCRIVANMEAGIEVQRGGDASIRNCLIIGNYYAIMVRSEGKVTVENCDLGSNEIRGIYYEEGSRRDSRGRNMA